MPSEDLHLCDEELLLAMDGELPTRDNERVQAHLSGCWDCRTRHQELQNTVNEFVRMRHRILDAQIPPADGPRALLKARLTQLAQTERASRPQGFGAISWRWPAAILGVACGLGIIVYFASQFAPRRQSEHASAVTIPDPSLTPGATILMTRGQVCRESNTKDKPVPVALRRLVFTEYGISAAQPNAYEVDYLITPALGGADDIHNLWPQSNTAPSWNARAKDVLEDHLRDLVCDGQLDLATAQHDIATNWIEAYKKYFHTERPLTQAP